MPDTEVTENTSLSLEPCFRNKVNLGIGDSLTLQFPFPSDLNPGLGGRKRRNSSTETARRVCCIACGLVSDKAEFSWNLFSLPLTMG